MAFEANRYTRVGVKAAEGSFIYATYDAASVPGADPANPGRSDRAAVIADDAGEGYFPLSAIPKNGALVAVRELPAAGDNPQVQLYVVNRVTIAAAGNVAAYETTRATAYGAAVAFSTDNA